MLLNDEDYRFAMNLLARCSVQFPNVKIVAFALMSNHIHLVISGKIELIENYFNSFRIRLTRYLCGLGRDKCPDSFAPQLKFIESVQELRTEMSLQFFHDSNLTLRLDVSVLINSLKQLRRS